MDARDAAEAALARRHADRGRIGYPRGGWSALRALVLARRAGRADEARRHEAARRALLDGATRSLGDDDLRRALEASTAGARLPEHAATTMSRHA